jgi:hypothetical protein
VDVKSGCVLGSLIWPDGNQIFAVDWIPNRLTTGFPFAADAKGSAIRVKTLFYTFKTKISWETADE